MRGRIDDIDYPALVSFPFFAGIVLGVWQLSLQVFNFDFAAVLFVLGGTGISIAFIGTMLSEIALAGAGYLSKGNYEREEWYVIAGLMAIIPIYIFVPLVNNFLDSIPILKFVLWVAMSGVTVFISRRA